MKKLLLCIALLATLQCVGQPLHISEITITPIACPGGVTGTITVTAAGGIPEFLGYFFQLNDGPQNQSLASVTFDEVVEGEKEIKVFDSVENDTITLNSLSSPFASIIFTRTIACSGTTVTYTVTTPTGSATTLKDAILVGPDGLPKKLTGTTGDFPDLQAGNYVLTLTPANAATVACDVPTILGFTVKQSALEIGTIENTSLSEGGTNGSLLVTVREGIGPFIFDLFGPLPTAIQRNDTQPDPLSRFTTFNDLPGGFFNLRITDLPTGCIATQLVAVNFFKNAVANRIALAYC